MITDGKWEVLEHSSGGKLDRFWIGRYCNVKGAKRIAIINGVKKEDRDNANLLAAAKDLYFACKALLSESPNNPDHWLRATKDAERAIEKADG